MNHPMKFYNREDELQELNLLRNAMPSMIVLTGRRRVGKTELIKKFLEAETGGSILRCFRKAGLVNPVCNTGVHPFQQTGS